MGYTRKELWSRIGLDREVEPLTEAAYDFFEWLESKKPNIGDAADTPWHVSFHGSSFPGDHPYPCGRKALYTMMDVPRGGFTRTSRAIMEAGKDIEDRLVLKWYLAGYLLSSPPPPFSRFQTMFEDPSVYLTSTVDSILLSPLSNRGFVCEVKSKYADVIEEMLRLYRGPDPKHIYQLKCQIGLAHEKGRQKVWRCYNSGRLPVKLGETINGDAVEVCPEHGHTKCLVEEWIEPVNHGRLYYVSRDKPDDTWEFYFDYDANFMRKGRAHLSKWKQSWLDGVLPQTNFEAKRFSHPFGWFWSKEEYPCKWCDYGDVCRTDHKKAIELGHPIKLDDSAAVEVAKQYRYDYDLDLVRMAVEQFWNGRRSLSMD